MKKLTPQKHLANCANPIRGAYHLEEFEKAYKLYKNADFQWKGKAAQQLLILFGNSDILCERLIQHPEWFDEQLDSKTLYKISSKKTLYKQIAKAFDKNTSHSTVQSWFRHCKYQQLIGIACKDFHKSASVEKLLAQWSDIADCLLQIAYDYCLELTCKKLGATKPCHGVIISLGKHGSQELNISSDIDIIYLYEHEGNTNPSNHEFHIQLCQEITRLLQTVTADGFVFRIDHELRPEGKQGTLANSLSAAEHYYENFGSDWERQAFVRARPVAGNIELGQSFLNKLQPFIYRKHLSISDLSQMQKMKKEMELAAKGDRQNIKVGEGGIREAEFFVQAHQLLHGGQHTSLRVTNTFICIEELVKKQFLHPQIATKLWQAYAFLRRTENMLQVVGDQQIHSLPQKPPDIAALARRLGFSNHNSFTEELALHQQTVLELFNGLFADNFERIELESTINANLLSCKNSEEKADSLSWFRHQEMQRICFHDLAASFSLPKILYRTTLLAEAVIASAYQIARTQLEERYGKPLHENGSLAAFAMVGFGKLGSQEMDYGSDLDVGFIYSDHGKTTGKKSISNVEFFTKLAQRTTSLLTTTSRYGKAYKVDAELRLSGRSGSLVSQFEAYKNYHQSKASTWEQLVLLKARVITGDKEFSILTQNMLNQLAYKKPLLDIAQSKAELAKIQQKFADEKGYESESEYNLKTGLGGISYLEMLTRFLQLKHLDNVKIHCKNTFELLEAFTQNTIIAPQDIATISAAFCFYRMLSARNRLQNNSSTNKINFSHKNTGIIAKQLGMTSFELKDRLDKHRNDVMKIYRKYMIDA